MGGNKIPAKEAGRGFPRGRLGALFRLRLGGGGRVVGETAAEFFHAAGGIDEFLGSGEERVAGGANTEAELGLGGAGLVGRPTGTGHGGGNVFGMSFRFHEEEN